MIARTRKMTIAAAAVAALAGSAFALTPTVQAAEILDHGPWYSGDGGDPATAAFFDEKGDDLEVCDIDSDGKKAQVVVKDETTDDYLYVLNDSKANGKCSHRHASDGGKYNIPEHHDITFVIQYAPSNNPKSNQVIVFNDH